MTLIENINRARELAGMKPLSEAQKTVLVEAKKGFFIKHKNGKEQEYEDEKSFLAALKAEHGETVPVKYKSATHYELPASDKEKEIWKMSLGKEKDPSPGGERVAVHVH